MGGIHEREKMCKEKDIAALIQALQDPNWQVRRDAARVLGELREVQAVASLLQLLQDGIQNVRAAAVAALGKLGEPAVVPLLQALQGGNLWVREAVVAALEEIGEPAVAPQILALIKDFQSKSSFVRGITVEKLGGIQDPQAIVLLVQALQDENSSVRSKAAEALNKLGWSPRSDIEKVHYLLATSKLDEIVKLGESAIRPLIQMLQVKSKEFQQSVVRVLAKIGDPAVVPLLQALQDETNMIRWGAIKALGEIGDLRAVTALIQTLSDEDTEVRRTAVDALGQLGDARAVTPLLQRLKDVEREVREVREEAIKALGKIGTHLEEVVPALLVVLQNEIAVLQDDQVQMTVKETLRTLVDQLEDPSCMIPILLDAFLKSKKGRECPSWEVQGVVEDVLGVLIDRLDPHTLVSAFLVALKNEEPAYHDPGFEAANGLGVSDFFPISPFGEMAYTFVKIVANLKNFSCVVPTLQAALNDENAWVRVTVARALVERAVEVEDLNPVVPVLLEAVKKAGNDYVNSGIAAALVDLVNRIEDPSVLIPALRKCIYFTPFYEDEYNVRIYVKDALVKIGLKVSDPSPVVEALLDEFFHLHFPEVLIDDIGELIERSSNPTPMVLKLTEALLDRSPKKLLDFLKTLAKNLKDPSPVVSSLLRLLEENEYPDTQYIMDIRWAAAEALETLCWRLANPSVLVTPLVSRFFDSGYLEWPLDFEEPHPYTWPVAWLFAAVVCRLSGFTTPVPQLRETLRELKEDKTRKKGGFWFEVCGGVLSNLEEPKVVIPTLLKLMERHTVVAGILGAMRGVLKEQQPLVLSFLQALETTQDHYYVVWALRKLEPLLEDPSPLIHPLKQVLKNKDSKLQYEATTTLAAIGERLQDPSLIVFAALRVSDFNVIYDEIKTLVDKLKDPILVQNTLMDILQDKTLEIRGNAVSALVALVEHLENPVPVMTTLLDALKDENPAIKRVAEEEFESFAPNGLVHTLKNPELVLPTLLDAVKDERETVRAVAVGELGALARFLEDPESVMFVLLDAMKDKNEQVRINTVWALGEIGDIRAVESLQQALLDADGRVRRAVQEALAKLQTKIR